MRTFYKSLVRWIFLPLSNALKVTTGFWVTWKTGIRYQVSGIRLSQKFRIKHPASSIKRRALLGLLVIALILYTFYMIPSAQASVGINNQINFQGKLVNPNGTNVADGIYNLQFKIYQDGDGVLGGGDETLKWTETRLRNNSQGVSVTNGIFQVNLGSVNAFGSSIDWNQDTI